MEISGIAGNWEIGQAGLAGEIDAGRGQDFSPEERSRRRRNRTGNASVRSTAQSVIEDESSALAENPDEAPHSFPEQGRDPSLAPDPSPEEPAEDAMEPPLHQIDDQA
jgi:hypothetical protein